MFRKRGRGRGCVVAEGKVATIVAFFGGVRIAISCYPDGFHLQHMPEGCVEATEATAMEAESRVETGRRCFTCKHTATTNLHESPIWIQSSGNPPQMVTPYEYDVAVITQMSEETVAPTSDFTYGYLRVLCNTTSGTTTKKLYGT